MAKAKNARSEIKEEFVLNVPNTLTLIRLVIAFVLVYLILFGYSFILIGVIFIFAALTDWFDGFFARRLKQATPMGARLDQVIDRVFMIPLVLVLLFKFYSVNQNMAYLLILCLSREIIATPGLIIRIIRNSDTYKVKYIGKATTFLQSVAVSLIIFGFAISMFAGIAWYFAIATGLVGIIAGVDYLRDSLK